eukprot:gnl/TRDRNA2_/TRDRNA2_126689_c0_seq1.p1 gnl/TRDRNA2_/TRDRNA2_126689_c0~~gnl/TRDRNA2_/TRDRNA2_126689_c0_seq1.p1  ORF type:complete len:231 (+),score=34.34 gnl/TRDRNA2_/TRDRNA2_126689_c0_seq1:73-765(+)
MAASAGSRSPSHSQTSMLAMQADSLRALGAVVRNTFIEMPVPRKTRVTARLSRSLPPRDTPCAWGGDLELAEELAEMLPGLPRVTLSAAPDEDMLLQESTSSSSASTACSEGDMSPEMSIALDEASERLAAFVQKECGWLRIHGHGLHKESSQRTRRRRGSVATLRFYVNGLPWAKRAKWEQPLLWAVAAVLQRNHPTAMMKGGELTVPLQDLGATLRIDFAAARADGAA